jgi:hypothetical protein
MKRIMAMAVLAATLAFSAVACERTEEATPSEQPTATYSPPVSEPAPAKPAPSTPKPSPPKPTVKKSSSAPAPARRCHSSYTGACLNPDASDYDCAGGSGNGPYYVDGPVNVVGPDEYRLDSDGDGIGCE